VLEPAEVQRWERLTAAMIRKAGQDDPEALAQVIAILDTVPDQLRQAVDQLRCDKLQPGGGAVPGYSWAAIGRALGVTRSAAQQRFGRDRLHHPRAGADMDS